MSGNTYLEIVIASSIFVPARDRRRRSRGSSCAARRTTRTSSASARPRQDAKRAHRARRTPLTDPRGLRDTSPGAVRGQTRVTTATPDGSSTGRPGRQVRLRTRVRASSSNEALQKCNKLSAGARRATSLGRTRSDGPVPRACRRLRAATRRRAAGRRPARRRRPSGSRSSLREAALEDRERALRPRAGERACLRDRGVAAGVAEVEQELWASRAGSRPAARRVTSCDAARRPATTPAIGARTSVASSISGNGKSSSPAFPTAIRSSHASPRIRHAALGQRLVSDPGKRLGRAEAAARAADQQDARQRDDAPRLGVDVQRGRRARSRRASSLGRPRARPRGDDGAPTAASTGQPATAAFCTSSNERRPLTQRIEFASGSRPAWNAQPMTLSIALWRPTSSRTHSSSSVRVEQPGRVQAAGHRERRLASAEPLGKRRRGAPRKPAARSRPAAPRPRSPRALPSRRRRTTRSCRSSAAAAPGRRPAPRARPCSRPGRREAAPPTGCRPSDSAKPSASSSSWPGRAHGHRNRTARDADLERLLDRDDVDRVAVRDPDDIDPARGIRHRPHAENVPAVVDSDEAPSAQRRLGT